MEIQGVYQRTDLRDINYSNIGRNHITGKTDRPGNFTGRSNKHNSLPDGNKFHLEIMGNGMDGLFFEII